MLHAKQQHPIENRRRDKIVPRIGWQESPFKTAVLAGEQFDLQMIYISELYLYHLCGTLLRMFYDGATNWCCPERLNQHMERGVFSTHTNLQLTDTHASYCWWFPEGHPEFWKFFLSCACLCLQGKYHGNPMHIAVIISNCLREERRILAAASMPVQVMNYISLICSMLICSHASQNKSRPLIPLKWFVCTRGCQMLPFKLTFELH